MFVMVSPAASPSNSDVSLASLELVAELATYGTVGSAFLASGVSPYDRQDVQFAFAEALADSVATPTYIHPAKTGALATSQYTDNKRCRLIVDEILMRALPKFSNHSGSRSYHWSRNSKKHWFGTHLGNGEGKQKVVLIIQSRSIRHGG